MSVDFQQPMVSIIIPTYNRAKYIIETIRSIQDQTYKNWELIIVDDGSDDNTDEIVSGLKDDRLQFIKAGRIGVGGIIKNIGLSKASGELVAFIDSDDLWAANKIEKQVTALQQYPEAGFCLTNGYNFKNLHEPIEYFYKQLEGARFGDVFISCFKSEVAGFTQALLFRKKCIALTGLFKEAKSFSDVDFIIRLALYYKAVILYEPLVYRRLHFSNYINSTWVKSYQEGIELIETYKKKLPGKIVRDALFKLYINFGEDHLQHKERIKAIGKFFQAWKYKFLSIVPLKKTAKAILRYFINS